MRKFLINQLALNHISIVFGKTINWVRIGNWAIPSFCIGGLYSIYTDMDFMNPMGILILLVIALQNLVALVYFRLKPIKWDELDLSQKWQYGQALFSQQLTKELPKSERYKILSEWDEVNRKFRSKLESKKFYNIGPFLVVPVSIIITVLTAILCF